MLNEKNFKYYQERLQQHKEWSCKLPEAAALQDLVEKCIKEKNYIDYYTHINNGKVLNRFDVIVIFPMSNPDYLFGIYNDNDDNVIEFSTPTGINYKHL